MFIVVFGLILFGSMNMCESETIFLQPGPGFNDGSDDGSANAGKDTTVKESRPYENSWYDLYLGTGVQTEANGGRNVSLIQFNVEGQPSSVNSAILRLKSWYGPGQDLNGVLLAYQVITPWNEISVTWNAKPSIFSIPLTSTSFNNSEGWVDLNITSLYLQWKSGTPNYGIMLRTDGNAGTCFGNGEWNCRPGCFRSSDYEISQYRPMLILETVSPPEEDEPEEDEPEEDESPDYDPLESH